jgi:branched-chain amino acid aminotransferase
VNTLHFTFRGDWWIFGLQTFNGDGLLECVKELIRLDKHWIPKEPGYSLYVRPTLSKSTPSTLLSSRLYCSTVGTQAAIGVSPPSDALLFVICCPVGPYYPQGFKPVALFGTTEYIRAAPGGTAQIAFIRGWLMNGSSD